MEEYIEVSAKTKEEAIMNAAIQLGTSSDNIEYDVIQEATSGLFGIGRKPAITAEITEISKYPSNADGNSYGGDSNPNASSYPFTAYIEDSDDLINHEYVDIQIEGNGGNGSSVYLPKALIRMENGQSYVYIEGKNKKLKKQYVRTGQT